MPPSTQATMPPTPSPASTLDELLACYDRHFIHCAYQTLLGRAPDPEGLGYYLGRLRTGFSKIRILAQLRLSKEGKAHAARLPGLDMAIERHKKEQYPLIGWLFRQRNGGEGNHPNERKLRAIENQLGLLSDESRRRFNQMEAALIGLHDLFVQQNPPVVSTPASILAATPDAPSIDLIQSTATATATVTLKQLSLRAQDIYFHLRSAAARHAGGTA